MTKSSYSTAEKSKATAYSGVVFVLFVGMLLVGRTIEWGETGNARFHLALLVSSLLIITTQVEGGGGESPAGPRVPNPAVWAGLENPVDPCLEGGGPVPAPVPRFADQFHHRDHLGSLRVVTGEAGEKLSAHDYYPFGQEMGAATPAPSRKKFTGHERDETTGLDYMLARYHSPALGRFLSVDPGFDVQKENPQSWNLYGCVRNDPLRFNDPTGREYVDQEGKDLRDKNMQLGNKAEKTAVTKLDKETERVHTNISEKALVKTTDKKGKVSQMEIDPKDYAAVKMNAEKAGSKVGLVGGTYKVNLLSVDVSGKTSVAESTITVYKGSLSLTGKDMDSMIRRVFAHESAHGVGVMPVPEQKLPSGILRSE